MKNKLKKLRDYLRMKRTYYTYNKKMKSIISSNNNLDINLTNEQVEDVEKFWGKFGIKPKLKWHKAYFAVSQFFDPKYIPEDIFYTLILPTLGNMDMTKAYADKNNYDSFFPLVRKPKTIIRNIDGNYYDNNYIYLKNEDVNSVFKKLKGDFVIKPTLDSAQGTGVNIIEFEFNKIYLNGELLSIKELEEMYKKDFIIQDKVVQNELINEVYPDSLNTFRIMSIKYQNKVYILSTILRLGNHGYKIDNFSVGGIAVGINSDGELNDFAVDQNFNRYNNHPYTNIEFKGVKIPKFNDAIEMVRNLHKQLFYFDLASWDLALNDQGEYVFIEVNLGGQGINSHQVNNGSLFGDKTETIMNSIFKK